MSGNYRTIVQYPRAINESTRRYTGYKKRNYSNQYKTRKAIGFSYTRTGRRLFRRVIKQELLQAAERKYIDGFQLYDGSLAPIDNYIYREGQLISPCGTIGPGTGNFAARIGNRITMTSFQMRICIQPFETTLGPTRTYNPFVYLRIIVFIWRDDSAPLLPQVIDSEDNTGADYEYYNVLQHLNVDRKVKREILYDKTTCHSAWVDSLTHRVVALGDSSSSYINIYLPMKRLREVLFNGETIPEYGGVNKLYVWLFSNCTNPDITPGYQMWPVYVDWRLNYKDV